MKIAIHFHDKAHTIVDNVTTYWKDGGYLYVRTLFGNCPETRMYNKSDIIAIFEVIDDGKRRIL